MKKHNYSLPWLIGSILVLLVGAFVNFYITNLVLSDISNAYAGLHDIYFIASVPGLVIGIMFVVAILYIGRYFLRPNSRKSLTKLYLIIDGVLALIGVITSILGGTIVYHSFTKPFPFSGYLILCLIICLLVLSGSIFGYIYLNKHMEEDTEKKKITFVYVLYTIALFVFVFFALNRLGAFLWSPTFIQWSTLYLTWPYYLWLLMPIVLLLFVASSVFKFREVGTKIGLIKYSIFTVIGLGLMISSLIIGSTNTQFVSAVSPTVGVERLLAKPVDTIIMVVLFVGFTLFFLIREIIYFVKNKKA